MSDRRQQADPLDLALVGLSALGLIFSFFAFYTSTVAGESTSASAWHGVLGWLAVVLMVVGGVLVLARISRAGPLAATDGPVAALYVVALICMVLAIFIVPDGAVGTTTAGSHVVKGHGFGFWVVFVCSLVGAAIAGFRFRARLMH